MGYGVSKYSNCPKFTYKKYAFAYNENVFIILRKKPLIIIKHHTNRKKKNKDNSERGAHLHDKGE